MAVEKAVPKEPTGLESPESLAVRELLKLTVKALKALRLYQSHNAISDRLETELFSRLSNHLEDYGAFVLTIREFEILLNDDLVYQSHDRNDSLAFLLFRDGIRKLTLHPGLQRQELHRFLTSLNRVAVLSNEQDDLVTLFWEEDFQNIEYYVVDELTSESEGPRLAEQLASGSVAGRPGADATPDSVSLKEIEQPVAHLPVEAVSLSEEEIEALRSELAKEESDPFWLAAVELAIDLALLETSDEERQNLTENLISILSRMLGDGEIEAVTRALEHLNGLAEMAFQNELAVRHMSLRLLEALSSPDRITAFLEHVERNRSLKPSQLTAYLARLGATALPSTIPWMGRMTAPAYRRAISEAVRSFGEVAIENLARNLPSGRGPEETNFLRETLYVLAHAPATRAVPLVETLLAAPDAETRRETALLLGRFKEPFVDELCLKLLSDVDHDVRSTALDTLVRSGRPNLASRLFQASLAAPNFQDRSLSEKRRTFAAVAKLGGAEALSHFVKLLRPTERRWFVSKKGRETIEAAVHGIRMVDTDGARELVQEMAAKADRVVRAACVKELAAERRT